MESTKIKMKKYVINRKVKKHAAPEWQLYGLPCFSLCCFIYFWGHQVLKRHKSEGKTYQIQVILSRIFKVREEGEWNTGNTRREWKGGIKHRLFLPCFSVLFQSISQTSTLKMLGERRGSGYIYPLSISIVDTRDHKKTGMVVRSHCQ